MERVARHMDGNLLLQTLAREDREALSPFLSRVAVPLGKTLVARDTAIDRLYFLEEGIASIVMTDEEGPQTELGLVGREGLVGTASLLGAESSPFDISMQVGGESALAIEVGDLQEAMAVRPGLRAVLLCFVQTLAMQSAEAVLANARYVLEGRLARWLLMCHDRVEGNRVDLTHQYISVMVSAQRPSVTVGLHILEEAGLIRAERGRITIRNRRGLEKKAAGSYGLAEAEYRRMIAPFGKSLRIAA